MLALFGPVLAYALGSVLFAPIVARRRGVDVYALGSGNPGATNVERALGKGAGALVLALDAGKGALAVLVASALVRCEHGTSSLVAAYVPEASSLAAVVGHVFPAHSPRRGGKGVATFAGALAVLDLRAAPVLALAYFVGRKSTGHGSVGSLAAVALGALVHVLYDPSRPERYLPALAAALVVFRHGDNLRRLHEGTEPRAGSAEVAKAPSDDADRP